MIIYYTDAEKAELAAFKFIYDQRISQVDAQIKLFNTAESQEKEKEIKSRLPKAPTKIGYDKNNKPIYDAAEKEAYDLVLNELNSFYRSRINELKENADYVALKNKRSILMDELNQELRQFENKCEMRQFNELGGDPAKIIADAQDQVTQLITNRYELAKAEQKEKAIFRYDFLRVDGKNLYVDIDKTLSDCQDFLKLHYNFFKDDQAATARLRSSILEAIEKHPNTSRDKGVLFGVVNDPVEKALSLKKKDMVLDSNYDVAMANTLIQNGINKLSANELKLLRITIMQSKMTDTELFAYELPATDLAKFLGISPKNLYRDLDDMTSHITEAFICLKPENKEKFMKINWVKYCTYENGMITIQLNDALQPFLLGLKSCFSKIKMEEYLGYKSKHSIILREYLEAKMGALKPYANVTTQIDVTIEELQRITNTKSKYSTSVSKFKAKVIDTALAEINDVSFNYHVTATPYKNGKKIEGFSFLIESKAGYAHRQQEEPTAIEVKKPRKTRKTKDTTETGKQLTIQDLLGEDF